MQADAEQIDADITDGDHHQAGVCHQSRPAALPASDEELALVEVGKDTRETVAATVGRPSASGLLNDVGWFYVQSRWEHKGAFPPKEIDRQVVSITFTEAGTVENVERFGLENGKVVAISRRVTQSNVKGSSFLKQLLGNIGRLRADQFID